MRERADSNGRVMNEVRQSSAKLGAKVLPVKECWVLPFVESHKLEHWRIAQQHSKYTSTTQATTLTLHATKSRVRSSGKSRNSPTP